MSALTLEYPHKEIACVYLNRPEKSNAFNEIVIAELTNTLHSLDQDPNIRAVILASKGKHFSAGADLEWMQRMVKFDDADNFKDAMGLAELLKTLYGLSKPTIALAQGGAFGGGAGLIACCDIAIATEQSTFCFSEVKLGLIPATIAPYVIRAIGSRAANYYFITAETFTGTTAQSLGLVHRLAPADQLEEQGLILAKQLLQNAPEAIAAIKKLSQQLNPIDEETITATAKLIAKIRVSTEAQKGLTAFLKKEKPPWQVPSKS